MPDQTHIVFATTGPYSHAPPLLRLARVIVETDPDILISVILHINNVPNAENILSSVENGKKDRIKLCACGTQGSLKDITKSYTDMLFHSGPQYASILAVSRVLMVQSTSVDDRIRPDLVRASSCLI